MSDGEARDGRGRFRRPDWKRPDGEAPETEGGVPVRDPARTAEELSLVLKPLKDLADAFRENSETMKGLADGQSRIAKRLERSDRSETMIQSTRALNDTFRGVQRTQERLMGRLEKEKRRPWYLLAGVLMLVGALTGGTVWYLTGWADRREEKARTESGQDWQAALADRSTRVDELQDRIDTMTESMASLRADAAKAEAAATEKDRRIAELEKTNSNLRENQAGVSRLTRENAGLSSEKARLMQEAGELKNRVQDLEAKLAEREAEIERMKGQLAGAAAATAEAGAKPAGAAGAAGAAGEEAGGTPAAAGDTSPAIPEAASQDPAELARVTSVLNGLLLDSKGSESWRIRKIGGIRGKVLYDVAVSNLDTGGAEAKRIQAAECRIVIDESQRRAELRFRTGHLLYYGVKAPFWGGTYVVSIVDIDPAAWLRSGLTIFDQVR